MNTTERITYPLIKLGAVMGLIGIPTYYAILYLHPPGIIGRIMFFSLGVLFVIFSTGLHSFLFLDRQTVAARLGALFMIIGSVLLTVMAVVQRAIFFYLQPLFKETPAENKEIVRWISKSVNAVQLGLDVSFDIFILLGIALVSVAMLTHKRLGLWLGSIGLILSSSTLAINIYTFPMPPGSAKGTFMDLGPFVGMWLLLVSVQMLRSLEWVKEKIQ